MGMADGSTSTSTSTSASASARGSIGSTPAVSTSAPSAGDDEKVDDGVATEMEAETEAGSDAGAVRVSASGSKSVHRHEAEAEADGGDGGVCVRVEVVEARPDSGSIDATSDDDADFEAGTVADAVVSVAISPTIPNTAIPHSTPVPASSTSSS